MKKDMGKKALFGIANPLGDSPCFCVPLFGMEKTLFYQLMDASGRIEGFTKAVVPRSEIQEVDYKRTFGVGDLAVHAFYFSSEERYVCTADELSKILAQRVDQFNERPFLQLEIGEFIGNPFVMQRAIANTSSIQPYAGTRLEVQVKSRLGEDARAIQRRFSEIRPRSFYPKNGKSLYKGPLHPALDELMDSFFREASGMEATEYFDEMYVRIPENEKIGERLLESTRRYSEVVRRNSHKYSTEPFLIIGRTGVGKSALLLSLENRMKLSTKVSRPGEEILTIHVNCLNFASFVEVIQEMLRELTAECKKSTRIWSFLERAGWRNHLMFSSIAKMKRNQAVNVLRGVLDSLQKKTEESNGYVVPVVFILDNIDRMPGFKRKNELVTFITGESRSRGYPFFGFTLRVETKHAIERTIDDMPPCATREVQPPTVSEILSRRLDTAFSDKVLEQASNWSERLRVELSLGNMRLQFEDLRKSLETAIRILTGKIDDSPPVIPSIAGKNMRNALTLCRVIIKSTDEKTFLKLSKAIVGRHLLIRSLMVEEYGYYSELTSKIRNLFSHSASGLYFTRLYVLKFLNDLQSRTGDFVPFRDWESLALSYGIKSVDFMDSAWGLMVGDFTLIDLEGTDDIIPCDQFKSIKVFQGSDIGVKVNATGNYYLTWLIYDVSYLTCVLQDTAMSYALAKALRSPPQSLAMAFDQTEKFLDFLGEKELEERARWGIEENIQCVVPSLKNRLERQKKALLSDEFSR